MDLEGRVSEGGVEDEAAEAISEDLFGLRVVDEDDLLEDKVMLAIVAHEPEEHLSGPCELDQGGRVWRKSLGRFWGDGEELRLLSPFQDPEVAFVFLEE